MGTLFVNIVEDESNPDGIRISGSGVFENNFTRDELVTRFGTSPRRNTITAEFNGDPATLERITIPNAIFLEAEDLNQDGLDDLAIVERNDDGLLELSIFINQGDIPVAVDDNVEITTDNQNIALPASMF